MAVISMHAGAAKFDEFTTQRLVGREVELLFAVIAEMRGGKLSGLEPVRADDLAGVVLLDQQMIAVSIVGIFVAPERVRSREPLTEFEIEDLETQTLSGLEILGSVREAQRICGAP